MMKQSKRILSVLLALVMICSTFTIGAQALKADISKPAGYDEVLDPVITSEQAACFLLDMVEPILADLDVYYKIDAVGIKLTIDLHDIDSLLDTLHEINNSGLVAVAEGLLDVGDIEKLDLSAGDLKDTYGNRYRRSSPTATDFDVLATVLSVLSNQTNSRYLAKFAYNGFDFGFLEDGALFGLIPHVFGNSDLKALNDVHGLVVTLVENLLNGTEFELDIETEYNNSKSLDSLLQNFIDKKLVKTIVDLCKSSDGSNQVAEILGLSEMLADDGTLVSDVDTTVVFPSLTAGNLGALSIGSDSTYDFVIKIFKALIQDIVIPYAGTLLADLLDDEIMSYVEAALPILKIDLTFPEGATAKEKVDILLNYLLVGEGKTKFICFKETTSSTGVAVKYLSIADGFWTELCDIIKLVLPMLPNLLGEDSPNFEKTDAELAEMSANEFLTYIIQACLEKFVDGVDFAEDCTSIRELASRTLIEVCKDLIPETDFEDMFESGAKIYDSDDCLYLAAYVVRYYLNGETTIQNNTPDNQMTFGAILNSAADWILDQFGALLGYDASKYVGVNPDLAVWQKLYDTVFQLIPLNVLCGSYPVSIDSPSTPSGKKTVYVPGVPDSAEGLRALIMDDIVGGVLEFNIEEPIEGEVPNVTGLNKVLSIIGRRSDSDLNKPLPQLIMDLLGRLINPIFGLPTEKAVTSTYDQKNLIIPYSYTTLDQLITTNHDIDSLSLTNTVYRLLYNLGNICRGKDGRIETSLIYTASPFITKILGLWGGDKGDVRFPFIPETADVSFNDGKQYNIDSLRELYEQYADSDEDVLSYDDDNFKYFHMVDFAPFLYLEFKSERSDLRDLIEQYDAGLADPATFRIDATNKAFRFLTIVRFLEQGYNMDKSVEEDEINYDYFGETVACDYQLEKVLDEVDAKGIAQEEYADGSKKYTERSWAKYEKALAFAIKVENEFLAIPGSKIDDSLLDDTQKAEKYQGLRDMRQSRINTARKELVKAMKELKAWIPLANYTELDAAIDIASYNVSLRMCNQKAIQKALDAYLAAINLERDYDADSQKIVSDAADALNEAITNLDDSDSLVDYMFLYYDGSEQFIEEDKGFLYGLPMGFVNPQELNDWYGGDFDAFMSSNFAAAQTASGEPCYLGVQLSKTGYGTGAEIYLADIVEDDSEIGYHYQERENSPRYKVVIFGDADGDSFADARDSVLLRARLSYKLTDAELGEAAVFASDLNNSGSIDKNDTKSIDAAGLMKEEIIQAPDYLTQRTYGILDKLGLR